MFSFIQNLINKKKPFKQAKTLKSGFLTVDDIHTIYYETSGNPKGLPVLNLHGGPGCSISAGKRRYFNPKKYYIIQFDQRGCGNSTPLMETKNNTTIHLVDDIEALRKHLNIDKWVINGGSWGSALGLCYAAEYKDRVLALFFNSIFLASQQELTDAYETTGVSSTIYPEAYAEFNPEKKENILKDYMFRIFDAPVDKRTDIIRQFMKWEWTIMGLNSSKQSVDAFIDSDDFDPNIPLLELHYMANNFYLDSDAVLNSLKNLNVPCYLVHGRYDLCCNASSAYKLHKIIKNSKLIFTFDGHSIKSKAGQEKLVECSNAILEDLNV